MTLLGFLIWFVVLLIVFAVIYWIIGMLGLPEPFNKIALAVLLLVFLIVLISILFGGLTLPAPHLGRA